MNVLRNRFLATASFLSGPNDPPQGGDGGDNGGTDGGAQDQDAGAGEDTGGADDGAGNDAGDDDSGGGADDDGDGGEGDGEGGEADDEDDLADLPPEVRAKVEKKIAKEVNWRDRQIDRLHRRTREAQEDVRAAETIVGRGKAPAANSSGTLTEADVETRARQLTAQQQFDNDANAADAKGREIYGAKWSSQLARLPKMGGVAVEDMVDILATDKPHVVLYSLAANPDEFERIMALPPARRRNEFVKLSLKPEPKSAGKAAAAADASKRPSGAPPPPRTLQNGRRPAALKVDLTNDKVSDEDWYAARNAERRKKFSSVD